MNTSITRLICALLFIMVMVIGVLLERETMVIYGGFLLVWNEIRKPGRWEDDDEVEKWS